jgi:hypothetical protein
VHDADTDGLTVLVLYVTSRFSWSTSRFSRLTSRYSIPASAGSLLPLSETNEYSNDLHEKSGAEGTECVVEIQV